MHKCCEEGALNFTNYRFRLGFVNELGEYVSEVDQISFKATKKGVLWLFTQLFLAA